MHRIQMLNLNILVRQLNNVGVFSSLITLDKYCIFVYHSKADEKRPHDCIFKLSGQNDKASAGHWTVTVTWNVSEHLKKAVMP